MSLDCQPLGYFFPPLGRRNQLFIYKGYSFFTCKTEITVLTSLVIIKIK